MVADGIRSGPASAPATCCRTAAVRSGVVPVICVGSAVTVSVCTVIARIVPSAVVIRPRSAGTEMLCSRWRSATARYFAPSRPCSWTSLPAISDRANPAHSRPMRRRRAGLPRWMPPRRVPPPRRGHRARGRPARVPRVLGLRADPSRPCATWPWAARPRASRPRASRSSATGRWAPAPGAPGLAPGPGPSTARRAPLPGRARRSAPSRAPARPGPVRAGAWPPAWARRTAGRGPRARGAGITGPAAARPPGPGAAWRAHRAARTVPAVPPAPPGGVTVCTQAARPTRPARVRARDRSGPS